jgi:hypothetical protein
MLLLLSSPRTSALAKPQFRILFMFSDYNFSILCTLNQQYRGSPSISIREEWSFWCDYRTWWKLKRLYKTAANGGREAQICKRSRVSYHC